MYESVYLKGQYTVGLNEAEHCLGMRRYDTVLSDVNCGRL